MKRLVILFFVLLASAALPGCGTASKATPYADLTKAEKARQALDSGNFTDAVTLYKEVIADDPEDYESYRFLAAAYAELGGFDLLAAVSSTLDSSSDNLLDTLSGFLPDEPTEEQIQNLSLATETLLRLPEERRSYVHPEIEDASSAAQQLQFYQTAYSLSYLKSFTQVTSDGTLDPSRLSTMTDEDVDNILNNFETIAATQGGGVVSEGVESFISQLDATPGGTRREKLVAYLEAHPPS